MPSSHCPRSKAIRWQVCQGALTGITREALVPRSSPCTKQVLILLLRLRAQRREKAARGVSGKQPWNPRGPEQRELHWPQVCSAGKSQSSPAIASARLSAEAAQPSPMGWPLQSTYLLSPHRGRPIPLLPAGHGIGSCPPQHEDQTQDFPKDQSTGTAG